MDYTIFYKKKIESLLELNSSNYDLFISSFNSSERVNKVFESVNAKIKHWIILPEYKYEPIELPSVVDGEHIFNYKDLKDESDVIRTYFNGIGDFLKLESVCIDITGFLRPYVVFLIRFLHINGVKKVDIVYSDPDSYKNKENTNFSSTYIDVKQIIGCEGNHNPETENDILIIGAGYDDKRISDVSKNKANARKVQVFGFPSLQPDMFQENIIKAYKAEEASMTSNLSFLDSNSTIFAPANDPFVTAKMISDFIKKENRNKKITNLYLSPLSTKAQTLGFALYFIYECLNQPVSMIFPYYEGYARETTTGISKIWIYTVEFPSL